MKKFPFVLGSVILLMLLLLSGGRVPEASAQDGGGFRFINRHEWRDLSREFINQSRQIQTPFCSNLWWSKHGGVSYVRSYPKNTCVLKFDYVWLDFTLTRGGGPAILKACAHETSFLVVNGFIMHIPGVTSITPTMGWQEWRDAFRLTPCQVISELTLHPSYATAWQFAVQHALALNPDLKGRFGDVGLDENGVPIPAANLSSAAVFDVTNAQAVLQQFELQPEQEREDAAFFDALEAAVMATQPSTYASLDAFKGANGIGASWLAPSIEVAVGAPGEVVQEPAQAPASSYTPDLSVSPLGNWSLVLILVVLLVVGAGLVLFRS